MSDFLTNLWDQAEKHGEQVGPIHARLWPGKDRALCTGEVVVPDRLSVEAHSDEDADGTCEHCLRTIREAAAEMADQ
jgi:hypothetical protein